jgi:hypothetical protein
MIEELIVALGSTQDNYIDYKSLNSGRISHLLKRRNEGFTIYFYSKIKKYFYLK